MADLISVVVPVYNVADDLPRCLDSILAQHYPNIEIITVNDGSSDQSGKVLDEYAQLHPCIHVVHQKNSGVTSARLRGVAKASGEWIGFVDGDDEIEPDMYERLLRNALEYDVEISHCGYQMIFADGRAHFFYNTGTLEKQDRMTALRELLSGKRIEPGLCNKLFRRELFEHLLNDGVMPTDIRINEDLLMNFFLFQEAKSSVYEDVCPYHYLVRRNSASRAGQSEHKILDPIRVKERILETAPAEVMDDARCAYMNTCINVFSSLALEEDKRENRSYQKRIRSDILKRWEWIDLLGKKRKVLAAMIRWMPGCYNGIYRLYARTIQKTPYE